MEQDPTAVAEGQGVRRGWATTHRRPSMFRGHPLGAQVRRAMERSAGAIPLAQHVLATAAGLGRAGRLADDLAEVSW